MFEIIWTPVFATQNKMLYKIEFLSALSIKFLLQTDTEETKLSDVIQCMAQSLTM